MEGTADILTNTVNKNASTILLFTVTFALTYWVLQSRQTRRRYPPALRSLPLIGSAPFLPPMNDVPEYFMQTAIKLKSNVFSYYQGRQFGIVINGRKAIKEALVKRSSDFADRQPTYTMRNYFHTELNGIIMSSYTSEYRKYHQLILSILREYGFGNRIMEERILAEAEDLTNRIKALKGEPFDPSEYLNICTINVINSIAFGQREPQSHPALKRMANFYQFFMNCDRRIVDFCPALRFLPKYKNSLEDIVEKFDNQHDFLLDTVQNHLENTPDADSFTNRFAERINDKLDVLKLKESLSDLLIAGSETTATSIHWSIYFMANNPEIQKRVRDQLDSVAPRDRFPSLDDMAKLPYVEAAMLEFMRIRTVLPLSIMRYTMCDTEVDGYFIPAKTRVIPNLYSVHMDPDEFPEPEVYRPERFLDSDGQVVGREKVISFSLGKRSCLGELLARQELFLLFSALVQRFNILPPEGQDKVHSEPRLVLSVVPTPFPVRLVPIED